MAEIATVVCVPVASVNSIKAYLNAEAIHFSPLAVCCLFQ